MKPFIYGNKKIEFGSHSGEVIGYDTIVKTHVSGSGGGGYNGRTAPVRISSHNEVIQKFFLKDGNNQETSYTLTNREIPLHDGQKITIIGGKADGNNIMSARVVNHNANGFWHAESGKKLAKNWGLIKEKTVKYLAVGFFSWIVMSVLLYSFVDIWALWVIMFAGTLLYVKNHNDSNNKIVKLLDDHIDELARGVLGSI
jgi:hypothetical protein